MIVLKEVNGAEKSWDERDYLKNYNIDECYIKTHSQTINNLVRWQYGITSGKNKSWREIENEMKIQSNQNLALSEMGLINLKKLRVAELLIGINLMRIFLAKKIRIFYESNSLFIIRIWLFVAVLLII